MVRRDAQIKRVCALLRQYPVVAILGARQVGKTTLAMEIAARWPKGHTYFDLEDAADAARLGDPGLALGGLRGLVVIDEIQRRAELFPALRVLSDRPRKPARFLILGSASPELLRQSSESLAGRIHYHELEGFTLGEVGAREAARLWLRGGFPRSFLAGSEAASLEWRRDFIGTYLERDLPALGIRVPAETLRRFWTMVAHYHGQIWNGSEIGRSLGFSDVVVRRYLDILASTFLVRLLRPWHENLGKRQVKAPKVYLSDTGLLHALLGLGTRRDLEGHPKMGASWEGFALSEVVRRLGAKPDECYFWATHGGAELDLLVAPGRRRLGFEFKRSSAPSVTRSMHTAMSDLGLSQLDVVYPGKETFPLASKIRAVGIQRIGSDLSSLTR